MIAKLHPFRPCILLAIFVVIPATELVAASDLVLSSEVAHESVGKIKCTILNKGTDPEFFDVWFGAKGFDFQLKDSAGMEIPIRRTWFDVNSPRDQGWIKTRTAVLQPQESFEYTLDLAEAFGPSWRDGKRLNVEWFQRGAVDTYLRDPSLLGYPDHPIDAGDADWYALRHRTVSPRLTVSLELPSEWPEAASPGTKKTNGTMAAAPGNDGAVAEQPIQGGHLLTGGPFWLWTGLACGVAIAGLAFWVFRKR